MMKDVNNIDLKLLNEDDLIVAYLKGVMSAEEEHQFFQKMKDNPELKEKAIVIARLVKGLKQVGEEQERNIRGAFLASSVQGIEAVTKQVTRQRTKTVSIRKASTWIAVAASVAFIVWIGLDYADYKYTTGLGEEYANTFPSEFSSGTMVRGADSPTEALKKLETLFAAVKKGENLDDAIHELTLYWVLSNMETANDYTDYSADIGWCLAIAYLKDNNKKEAKKILEKMETLDDIDPSIEKKVRELLKMIQ